MKKVTLLCLSFILLFITLCPIFFAGYCSDDTAIFLSYSNLEGNFWQKSSQYFISNLTGFIDYGRPMLANSFWRSFFMAVTLNQLNLYHVGIIALVLIGAGLFYYFCYFFLKFKQTSIWIIIFLSILIQFRYYHDPLISFFGIIPFSFICLMLTLIFLGHYFESSKKIFYFSSLISYICLLTMHELNIVLLGSIAIFFIFKCEKKYLKKNILAFLPFLLLSILLLIFSLILSKVFSMPIKSYSGLTYNFSPLVVIQTFISQVTSAFPFSYFLLRYRSDTLLLIKDYFKQNFVFVVPIIILVFLLFISIWKHLKNLYERNSKIKFSHIFNRQFFFILLFALTLVLLPALPEAISVKYQEELGFLQGLGYISVYYQYFGVALLFSLLIDRLLLLFNQKTRRYILLCVILLSSTIFLCNFILNNRDIKYMSSSDDLNLVKQAYYYGLFQPLSGKDVVLVTNNKYISLFDDPTYNLYLYRYATKNNYNIVGLCVNNKVYGLDVTYSCDQLFSQQLFDFYYLSYQFFDRDDGSAILSHVSGFNESRPIGDTASLFNLGDNTTGGEFSLSGEELKMSTGSAFVEHIPILRRDNLESALTYYQRDNTFYLDTLDANLLMRSEYFYR